jgi:hypothetical protein
VEQYHPEYSAAVSPNTPFSKGYFLRPTTNAGPPALKKEFDLTGIPHSMVEVVFTYHMFDDWDSDDFGFAAFATQAAPYTGQAGQSNGIFQDWLEEEIAK